MNARRFVAALSLLVVVVSPALGASLRIKATGDNLWDPKKKRVERGTIALWKNPTEQAHDLRIWKSPIGKRVLDNEFFPGDVVKKRLRKKGVYHYRCRIHSVMDERDGRKVCEGMCGKIRVVASS